MPMNDEKPWKQLIKHVERLDDTVTRLVLEMAEVRKQIKNCECEDEPTSNDGGIPIPIHRKKLPNSHHIKQGNENV